MMRLTIVFIILFFSISKAQGPSLKLNLRMPVTPKITDWQLDPSILQVVINFPPEKFYIDISLFDGSDNKIISTNKKYLQLFRGTPTGLMMLSGNEIFNYNTLKIDQSIKTTVTTTNLLPEGNYTLCVQLLDENKSELGEPTCVNFSIFIPDPPNLLFPFDGNTINNFPQFNWTPVLPGPDYTPVQYKIDIVPIFRGQAARDAMDRNPSLLNKIVTTTTYQYLPTDQPFNFYHEAFGFAWQVQALDEMGKPATRNDGKSEIFTFYLTRHQDSTDINSIELSFLKNIKSLTVRFEDNDAIQKTLVELEKNSQSIFNNIKNPAPEYLESLAGNGSQLAKILSSSDSVASSKIIEISRDMAVKEKSREQSNDTHPPFQKIKFTLKIFQADGLTPVNEAFHVRAKPWAERDKNLIETFGDRNVHPEIELELVAGVYDMWVVPVSNEEKRFPEKSKEKEIEYPMNNPIEINIK